MNIKKIISGLVITLTLFCINSFSLNAATNFLSAPDLELGNTHSFVIQLQKLLNSNGYIVNSISGQPGSRGYESDYFGKMTQKALSAFQSVYNITPTAGYFGPKTKSKINELVQSGKVKDESVAVVGSGNLSSVDTTGCSAGYAKAITQYDITWTFSECKQYGQFVNGDYWVIGPIVLSDINPKTAPGGSVGGSMINPVPNVSQGFYKNGNPAEDLPKYDSSKNISLQLPKAVPVDSSVYSTINNPDTWKFQVNPDGTCRVSNGIYGCAVDPGIEKTWFKETAVLTVLGSAPPVGSFRPPYSGNNKEIKSNWKLSSLNYSVLGNYTIPNISNAPSMKYIVDATQRPLLEMYPGFLNSNWKATWGEEKAGGYPRRAYGREVSGVSGGAGLLLNSNFTNQQKEQLAINMVQWGIDTYGLLENGMEYQGSGGHQNGRLLPLYIAGKMLNDSAILSKAKNGPLQETLTHYIIGDGQINVPRNPPTSSYPLVNKPYTEDMRNWPEWTFSYPGDRNNSAAFSESETYVDAQGVTKKYNYSGYRDVNGGPDVSTVTTILLMNGRSDIANDAFFRYILERYYPNRRDTANTSFSINSNGIQAFARDMLDVHILKNNIPTNPNPTTPTPNPTTPNPTTLTPPSITSPSYNKSSNSAGNPLVLPSTTKSVRIEWENKNSNYLVRYNTNGKNEVDINTHTDEYYNLDVTPGQSYHFWVHTGTLDDYSKTHSDLFISVAPTQTTSTDSNTPTDSDSDTVTDSSDRCPNTKSGIQVNAVGCPIPTAGTFDSKPSDLLSSTKDLSNVTDFYLAKTGIGRIDWGSQALDLQKTTGSFKEPINLDTAVIIKKDSTTNNLPVVSVNPDAAPNLNKPARITVEGFTFAKAPKIKRNGVICDATTNPICTFVSYTNGTLVFDVSGFSEYSFEEDTSTTPPPTTTPSTPSSGGSSGGSSSGGGGGGGGGSSSSSFKALCSVSDTTVAPGSTVSFNTTILNAITPYTYTWTGTAMKLAGFDKTKEDQLITFPTKGTYTLKLQATGKTGKRVYGLCRSVNVDTKHNLITSSYPSQTTFKPSTTSSTGTSSFLRDLTLGSRGEDVRALQKYLNSKGFNIATSGDGSLGKETDYFGPATRLALIRFQTSKGIVPAVGYFGALTRGVAR